MKRDEFEEIIEAALAEMIASGQDTPPASSGALHAIGGIVYGDEENRIARAVCRLASHSRRAANPILPPSPYLVPPCF